MAVTDKRTVAVADLCGIPVNVGIRAGYRYLVDGCIRFSHPAVRIQKSGVNCATAQEGLPLTFAHEGDSMCVVRMCAVRVV